MNIRIYTILTIMTMLILSGICLSYGEDAPAQPVIFAPQGLSSTEQGALERNYRFSYRDKTRILSPFLGQSGEGEDEEAYKKEQSRNYKVYRYFDAARGLHRDGKLEEAVDILKYLCEKNPEDRYIKEYLDKVIHEKDIQFKKWKEGVSKDAAVLKKNKLEYLIQDGIGSYEQKKYDIALMRFYDAITLDPTNGTAVKYLELLKKYYLREIKIDKMVEDREKQAMVLDTNGKSAIATNALDKQEDGVLKAARKILDDEEMKNIVKEKRSVNILDQVELELRTEEILNRKAIEDRRANMYTLGSGDLIQVSVRDHPELSGKAQVRLNGEIILPLVNDLVKVKDMTLPEATGRVKDALKRYIKNPFVALAIEEYKSKTFYVMDEVGCTPYPITRANLTLRDALFTADWGDNRALGRVIVMKPDKLHPIIKKVDAFDIMYRGNLMGNLRIEDGDVIYAPMTVAAKISQTIVDTLKPFQALRQARNEWINYKADKKTWKDLPQMRQTLDYSAWNGEAIPSAAVNISN